VEPYADLLPELDMLLLMTVEPGFGGQPFLDVVLPKLHRARTMVDRAGLGSVAAGRRRDLGRHHRALRRSRGDVFVAGSAVFGAADPAQAVADLRARAERATLAADE
jgi:ribulose-phosphate 3-epimerase